MKKTILFLLGIMIAGAVFGVALPLFQADTASAAGRPNGDCQGTICLDWDPETNECTNLVHYTMNGPGCVNNPKFANQ